MKIIDCIWHEFMPSLPSRDTLWTQVILSFMDFLSPSLESLDRYFSFSSFSCLTGVCMQRGRRRGLNQKWRLTLMNTTASPPTQRNSIVRTHFWNWRGEAEPQTRRDASRWLTACLTGCCSLGVKVFNAGPGPDGLRGVRPFRLGPAPSSSGR